MTDYSGSVALVTGANRGIGFEVVRQLARVGFSVVLGSRDESKGEKAAGELAREGLKVFATEMGGPNAPRTPEEGARGIVWAATLPESGPTGGFFRDGEPLPW